MARGPYKIYRTSLYGLLKIVSVKQFISASEFSLDLEIFTLF